MADDVLPILEHDPDPEALIQPERLIPSLGGPERCVLCFFQEVIERLVASGEARPITTLKSEIGVNPV